METGTEVRSTGTVGAGLAAELLACPGVPGVALDEVLRDQALGLDVAARVVAELEAPRHRHHDPRLVVLGQLDVLDRADARAGDLDELAGDDALGGVEDRVDAVGAGALGGRADRPPRRGPRATSGDDDGGDAASWRDPEAVGRVADARRSSMYGFEPSSAGLGRRRPGSGSRCSVWKPPRPLPVLSDAGEHVRPAELRPMRREVAVGVVVARRAVAEAADDAVDDLGRVRAQAVDDRQQRDRASRTVERSAGTALSRSSGSPLRPRVQRRQQRAGLAQHGHGLARGRDELAQDARRAAGRPGAARAARARRLDDGLAQAAEHAVGAVEQRRRALERVGQRLALGGDRRAAWWRST